MYIALLQDASSITQWTQSVLVWSPQASPGGGQRGLRFLGLDASSLTHHKTDYSSWIECMFRLPIG
jgi:hypothetical protein